MSTTKATPTVVTLAAMALAAAGFYGGVEAQKSQGEDAAVGASAGAPSTSAATTGIVKATGDGTLTVTTSEGATVRVKTGPDATVTRNAKTQATEVHPGDTVVIAGTTVADGTVTATSVTASSAG
jgi:hypothetical protein